MEFFGSLEAIADAKSEIFEGVLADGIAILNRDSPLYGHMAKRATDRPGRLPDTIRRATQSSYILVRPRNRWLSPPRLSLGTAD